MIYPWQQASWKSLQDFLASPTHHALLLHGPSGIGKWELAREMAAARLCSARRTSGMACGACVSCKLLAAHTHPDLLLLVPDALRPSHGLPERELKDDKKPSKEIQVDDVRDLVDQCTTTTHLGGARVVLVCPAEAMNTVSANTLLKTLEEPPSAVSSTLFILVSHEPQQLLPTVRSRCRALAAPKPSLAEAAAFLSGEAGAGVDVQALLALHGARPLLARDAPSAAAVRDFVTAVAQAQWAAALKFDAKRHGNLAAVHGLMAWVADVWSLQAGAQPELRFPSLAAVSGEWATRLSARSLRGFAQSLHEAARVADHPVNSALFIEALLVRLQATQTT